MFFFLLIRSIVVVFYRSRCLHPVFSSTRFYIFIEETINKESFAFSPGLIYILHKTPINFNQVKVTLPPIAVETTNIPTTISCSLHNRHYFFIYSRVITSVFIIHGCYIPFQFALLTTLYFFYENYENDLLGNTPLSENDPSKPIKILKMTPQRNAPPPSPPPSLTCKGSASYCPPTWYSRVY